MNRDSRHRTIRWVTALLVCTSAISACGSQDGRKVPRAHPTPTTVTSAPATELHTSAVGGCPEGSSPCVTTDVAVHARGSRYIDVNLLAALAVDHPELLRPAVTCPQSTTYPVTCRFAANHDGPVSGTLTVLGVEVRTRTYAYSIEYRPTN